MASTQAEIRALGKTNKDAALAKLREFKQMKADFEALLQANPEVRGQLQQAQQPAQAQKAEEAKVSEKPKKVEESKVSEQPQAPSRTAAASGQSQGSKPPPQTNDEVLDVYDEYHNPEEIKSVMVIDSEIKRCTDIVGQLKGFNEELVNALEERIDILQF